MNKALQACRGVFTGVIAAIALTALAGTIMAYMSLKRYHFLDVKTALHLYVASIVTHTVIANFAATDA